MFALKLLHFIVHESYSNIHTDADQEKFLISLVTTFSNQQAKILNIYLKIL